MAFHDAFDGYLQRKAAESEQIFWTRDIGVTNCSYRSDHNQIVAAPLQDWGLLLLQSGACAQRN